VITQETQIQSKILESFLDKSPKEVFKVWHFVYNKGYDYNTEDGLKKYKAFKKNLMEIKAVNNNSENTWKAGLNEYSDLSFEDFSKFIGLAPLDVEKIRVDVEKLNKSKGFRLDDYNDDNEVSTSLSVNARVKVGTPSLQATTYDYRAYSLPPRAQGSCSSCWAFATMGQIENSYWSKYGSTAGAVNQYLSVQQLVDCDLTSKGCQYGYPSEAMNYLLTNPAMPDSNYTYTAVTGTCRYNSSNTVKARVTGMRYGGTYYYPWYPVYVLGLLANGPVVALVGANSNWTYYKSGIFSSACASGVNHSVLVVGYGLDSVSGKYYYIVRNSWGTTWGESGYIRILDDGVACSIPKYGYQAIIA
jgi:C1A family cysteine protease